MMDPDMANQILAYEIRFGGDRQVGVAIPTSSNELTPSEFIRLWAGYSAVILFNLGFPEQITSQLALRLIAKVAESPIEADTYCFDVADVDDVIHFDADLAPGGTTLTGKLLDLGDSQRGLLTDFPSTVTEQQVVFGSLALMQYAILQNRADQRALDVLGATASGMVRMYEDGLGDDLPGITVIPNRAYLDANSDSDE